MVAVIGDIHGCYNTLRELVKRIKDKYSDITLYSVGDLIDRGNFSCEVLDYVISENIRFTPGNHDYMFYYFVKHPSSQIGRAWLYNGSETTIASYESRLEKMAEHLNIIINAPLFISLQDCFISHAGISKYYQKKLPANVLSNLDLLDMTLRPDITSEHGILWTRDELMDIGRLQLVGHTRQDNINLKSNNVAYIDTSVYTGNKLSAVVVENNLILDTFSVPTFDVDIK